MRLLPESAAEFGSNIPWIMEKRLKIIEEIALGSQTSGRDAPDMDEAWECMWEAVGRRDQEAEDEAFVDHTRAEVWEWWQGFSERPLLTDLYWRAARREAKSGSLDSRRRPSHSQGVRIARALFADISDKGQLDPEQESATVAQVLAAQLLPPGLAPFFAPAGVLVSWVIEPLLWPLWQRSPGRGCPGHCGDVRRCSAGATPLFSPERPPKTRTNFR